MLLSLQKFFNLIFSLHVCQFSAFSLILTEKGIGQYVDESGGLNDGFDQVPLDILGKKKEENITENKKNYDLIGKKQKEEIDSGLEKAFTSADEEIEAEYFTIVPTTEEKLSSKEEYLQEDQSNSAELLDLNFSGTELSNSQEEESKSEEERKKRQVVVRRRRRRRRRPCRCKGKRTKVIKRRRRGRRRGRRVKKCICKKKKKAEDPEPPPTEPPEEEEGEYEDYDWLEDIDTTDGGEEEKPEEESPEPPPGVIISPTQPTIIYPPPNPIYGYGYGGSPSYTLVPRPYPGLHYGTWPYYGVSNGIIPVYSYPAPPKSS